MEANKREKIDAILDLVNFTAIDLFIVILLFFNGQELVFVEDFSVLVPDLE